MLYRKDAAVISDVLKKKTEKQKKIASHSISIKKKKKKKYDCYIEKMPL